MTSDTIRMCPPSRFSEAPYGTVVKVLLDDKDYQVYVQSGDDEHNPVWILRSIFLENIFSELLEDPEFMQACLLKDKSLRMTKISIMIQKHINLSESKGNQCAAV